MGVIKAVKKYPGQCLTIDFLEKSLQGDRVRVLVGQFLGGHLIFVYGRECQPASVDEEDGHCRSESLLMFGELFGRPLLEFEDVGETARQGGRHVLVGFEMEGDPPDG